MLKLYSLLIGENPAYTATFQPSSKRKIALYANCMMVPILLWFINGYLMVKNVLEGSVWMALLTATILAFIIFLIERAVIMSNGSKSIAAFRISLGFIVASLGSICMDEVIFKHDIDNQIAQYIKSDVDNAVKSKEAEYKNQLQQQQIAVEQKSGLWAESLKDAKKEADGTGGSGVANVGKIAKLKLVVAAQQEKDYHAENVKLQSLRASLEAEKKQAALKAENEFNDNALLIRIRALFELISKDKFMMGVYILFTALLFLIEFMVVIIKIGSKKSIDEELEEARLELLCTKTRKTLNRASVLYDVEQYIPSVNRANNFIKENPASIFN
jgi:hypothetical protein